MLTPVRQHDFKKYGDASATTEALIVRGTYPLSRATRNSGEYSGTSKFTMQ